MVINSIYNIDCNKGMNKMIKDNLKVNLIIADPPYVISKKSQFHTMKDRKKPRKGTDFGEWDKGFNNKPWIKKSYELLNNGGSLLVFNDFKKASDIINYAQSVGFIYKDTLIWKKTNPMPRNRDRRYVPDVEMIIWFVKPGKWIYNRQNSKYESSVISIPSESGGGYKRYHPTQKPVKLIEYLIKIHSNENDLILDPFMGSGTTAISAKNTNRKYIGFELNKEYFELSIKRINGNKNE